MVRFSVFVCLLIVFCGGTIAQNPSGRPHCLTDELHEQLRERFPEGVPGRTLPLAVPAEKTADFGWTYVIPIVVHVMHDNGPELNVNLAQVQSQIDVLNEDYGRYGFGSNTDPAGADVKIRFCLATVDPDGNPTTGLNFFQYPATANIDPFNEDTLLKKVIQWDPLRYLNTYVVRQISNGRISGYAYFPDEAAGTIYDGFVVDHRFFGRDAGTALERGRTATHEVGHYLGLLHPWGLEENFCDMEDDGCDDTPKVGLEYFSNYPTCAHPAGCNGDVRMIENYMDYSDDACMNIFTQCQAQKMRRAILEYRYELVSSVNLAASGCNTTLQGEPSKQELVIFPNPVQNVLMVYADYADNQISEVEIIDFSGRRVYRDETAGIGRGPFAIDVSAFNEGLYHLVIRRGGLVVRKSILVAR
jgi:hypothetical protein